MKRSSLPRSAGPKRKTRLRARKADPAKECKWLCRRLVVELRDQNTCQRCGASSERSQIHWAHVKNRGAKSLVCAPWASLALCAGCHFWFDAHKGSITNPGDGMKWWIEKFPERAVRLSFWNHQRNRPKINYSIEKLWLEQELAQYGIPLPAAPKKRYA